LDVRACGPGRKKVDIARMARRRRALLIAGLIHIWESNLSTPTGTLHPACAVIGRIRCRLFQVVVDAATLQRALTNPWYSFLADGESGVGFSYPFYQD